MNKAALNSAQLRLTSCLNTGKERRGQVRQHELKLQLLAVVWPGWLRLGLPGIKGSVINCIHELSKGCSLCIYHDLNALS
jgi:hypothetical protein